MYITTVTGMITSTLALLLSAVLSGQRLLLGKEGFSVQRSHINWGFNESAIANPSQWSLGIYKPAVVSAVRSASDTWVLTSKHRRRSSKNPPTLIRDADVLGRESYARLQRSTSWDECRATYQTDWLSDLAEKLSTDGHWGTIISAQCRLSII